jgi:hypothetical protein
MPRYRLPVAAKERDTYFISVNFFDEYKAPVTPDTATWTLTDRKGAVVNFRSAVIIPVLASSVVVLLKGNDLAFLPGEEVQAVRVFTVQATYTSPAGSGLPLTYECEFAITDLIVVE